MDQPRRRAPVREGLLQSRYRQPSRQCAVECPIHNLSGIRIENHRQVDELRSQANIGEVRNPELIHPGEGQAAGQAESDRPLKIRIRRDHEGSRLHGEQVVCPYEPRYSLVV